MFVLTKGAATGAWEPVHGRDSHLPDVAHDSIRACRADDSVSKFGRCAGLYLRVPIKCSFVSACSCLNGAHTLPLAPILGKRL